MYDAVFVLVEAFNRILRKKPDQFRANHLQRRSHGGGGSGSSNALNESSALLDCNTSKGWVTPWEQGEKISRVLRKVSHTHTHTHTDKNTQEQRTKNVDEIIRQAKRGKKIKKERERENVEEFPKKTFWLKLKFHEKMLKIIAKGGAKTNQIVVEFLSNVRSAWKLFKFNFEAKNKMIIAGILLENVERKRRYAGVFESSWCR